MASLFNLSLEFYALKDLIDNDFEVDEETGEFVDNSETINNLFNDLKMTFEDKLDNSQRYILTLDGEAEILAKEIKRLQARKTALNNKADRLLETIKNAILSTGENKFKTSLYNFNIKRTESVEVRDLDVVPRAYLRLKKEADKVAIKKALKDTTPKVGFEYTDNNYPLDVYVLTEIKDNEYILLPKDIIDDEKILNIDALNELFTLVKGNTIEGVYLSEKLSLGVK
jgi:hypothetical protein